MLANAFTAPSRASSLLQGYADCALATPQDETNAPDTSSSQAALKRACDDQSSVTTMFGIDCAIICPLIAIRAPTLRAICW